MRQPGQPSPGTCASPGHDYHRGYHGHCYANKNMCIKRWILNNINPVRVDTQHVLGSDGKSCACNKANGYCFSKVANQCESFKARSPDVYPPAGKKMLLNNTMTDVYFGADKNNFCTHGSSPFAGEGCRMWRKNHKCGDMMGLHTVHKPMVENCLKLAEEEKKCYTEKGGGKIILLDSSYMTHKNRNSVTMCFCSVNSCADEHPHANYHTFACGGGAPESEGNTSKKANLLLSHEEVRQLEMHEML